MSNRVNAAVCFAVVISVFSVFAQTVKTRQYNVASPTTEDVRVRQIEAPGSLPYEGEQPFAFSVMPGVSTPQRSWDSVLFRFNLFVGAHRNVYWLDIGVLGNVSDNEMTGLGLAGLFNSTGSSPSAFNIAGVCNYSEWNFNGLQLSGGFCWTEGRFSGLQVALINSSGRLNGFQIGGVNIAEQGVGTQVGIVNVSSRFQGLQVGVINANLDSSVPVLPVLNFAF